jgi:hypothetical protein
MIKKCTFALIIIALVFMICLTSCDLKIRDESKEPMTTPMTLLTTPTPEATTTAAESSVTEPSSPISAEKVVFEEYELDLNVFSSNYLLRAQKAFVYDHDVSDGLLAQDEFAEVKLPEGTILQSLDIIRPGLEPYPGKMLFILADGRCVFFDQSISDDGKPIYNGMLLSDMVGGVKFYNLYDEGEPKEVENYELLPNMPKDYTVSAQNIIVNVDWNGDGTDDTITRECASAERTWDQTVWYTDGATGKKTDISDRFARDINDEYGGLTNEAILFLDEKTGEYALIDCFDTCSSDYSIFVYTYDPQTIVKYTERGGIFLFEEGKMYECYPSFIFGSLGTMKTPVIFSGEGLESDPSDKENWWLAAMEARDAGDEIPGYFSYTLKDVPVEKKTADGYEEYVIPAGIAVFPKYYIWNDNEVGDSGYLYFVLADGSEYRIAFEQEPNDWDWTLGGVPQGELFHCAWGG